MSELFVKVCGLTRAGDVMAAIEAGADAIGLILVPRSPRRLDPQRASELAAIAKGRAEIYLLVEEAPDAARQLLRRVGADGLQPYGPHARDVALAAAAEGIPVLLPQGVDTELPNLSFTEGVRPLLDTAVDGTHGGTGLSFDWSLVRSVPGVVVAGGLHPANVAAAVIAAQPTGVDASSGLEAAVGQKDHGKVADFVAAARAAASHLEREA